MVGPVAAVNFDGACREQRLADERAGRAKERLELRELRSREAGYLREIRERTEEVEELNQVTMMVVAPTSLGAGGGVARAG